MIMLQINVVLQVTLALQYYPTIRARINLTILRMSVSNVGAQMFHFFSADWTHLEWVVVFSITIMYHLLMLLQIFWTFEGGVTLGALE